MLLRNFGGLGGGGKYRRRVDNMGSRLQCNKEPKVCNKSSCW